MTLPLFDHVFEQNAAPAPAPESDMRLRPYQQDAVSRVLKQFETVDSTLVVKPTGTGKTVVFASLIERIQTGRVMVLAHREELIFQAADKIQRVTGIVPDIEMASRWANEHDHHRSRVVVSSIQTQVAGQGGGRMLRFKPEEFRLVIVDEAHHATAGSYRKVLAYYRQNPTLKVLGVTATPDRKDQAALGQIFDSVAFRYEINDAITDGWLVPIRQSIVRVEGLNFAKIKTTAGDLNQGELAHVMEEEKTLHALAHPTIELAKGRKTLVFATSVAHAERLCEIFNRRQPNCARWVCGKTPKDVRRDMFRDYAAGAFQICVNVGVLTEGFDEPGVQVVAIGRPTKSRALYCQMVGRGTRPLPGIVDGRPTDAARRQSIADSGKPWMEIIDFVGNAGRHKLVSSADILGGQYANDVVARANKQIEKATRNGQPADVGEELQRAKAEIDERQRKEAERRKHVVADAQYDVKQVDPFDLLDVPAVRQPPGSRWRPPTDKQRAFLERNGVNTHRVSFEGASRLIDAIKRRQQQDLCTFKQVQSLKQMGVEGPRDLSISEASMLIDWVKNGGAS